MSEDAMVRLVEKIEASQWRVAIIVGLGSILLSVSLAWILARGDIAYIHDMIKRAECQCKTAAHNANTVTITTDPERDKAIRDILKKQ